MTKAKPGPKKMPPGEKKETVTMTLAPDLARRVTELAEREGISRSAFVEQHMRRVVERADRKAA